MAKVIINKISPTGSYVRPERDLFTLGVSMNNPFFFRKDIFLLIDWLKSNFHSGTIVIGDYLNRHNEYILTGNVGPDSVIPGLQKGKEFIDYILDRLKHTKIKIIRWSDFYSDPNFFCELKNVYDLFENNPSFHNTILLSCEDFIRRQIKRGTKYNIPVDEAIKYSTDYVLEETAAFGIMNRRGYNNYIYPGKHLEITEKLSLGSFPEISTALHNMTLIETKIKR